MTTYSENLEIYRKKMEELKRRVIMKERIIETAGRTWHYLKDNGQTNLVLLPKRLKEKTEVVNQAVGWLAREDKVQYIEKNGKTFIALNE